MTRRPLLLAVLCAAAVAVLLAPAATEASKSHGGSSGEYYDPVAVNKYWTKYKLR